MPSDPLSTTLAALAHPTRRAILARLAAGAATVKELSTPFRMSAPAVSRHLRVLEGAGLITRSREGQWRPCRLKATPLREVCEWTDAFRPFWNRDSQPLDIWLQHLRKKARA